MDSIANQPSSDQSALDCRILHIQSQTFSGGDIARPPQKRPRCLDPDTNFRLSRQRSHCSCCTKRQLVYSQTFQSADDGDSPPNSSLDTFGVLSPPPTKPNTPTEKNQIPKTAKE